MTAPRFPWPMGDKRRGGPLLGPGGPPTLFSYRPVSGGSLPVGATFIRASASKFFDGLNFEDASTGVIIDDAVAFTGGAKGYLAQRAAANFLPTTDLTDAAWTEENIDPIVSNGTNILNLPEYLIDVGTSGPSVHRIFDGMTASNTTNCYYFIAKQGPTTPGRYVSMQSGASANEYVTYDLQTGTVTDFQTGPTSDVKDGFVIDLGNRYYQCCSTSDDPSPFFIVVFSDVAVPGTMSRTWTGSNEEYLFCQVQYTENNIDSVPILTPGSARAADVLDTGAVIDTEWGCLLDITVPGTVGPSDTLTLLGVASSAVDVLRLAPNALGATDPSIFDLIMDDGGTPVTIGTVTAGTRVKISYGRGASSRSASLNGATVVAGGAPGAAHEGDTYQVGAANSVNQSHCIHHITDIYIDRPSDEELQELSA